MRFLNCKWLFIAIYLTGKKLGTITIDQFYVKITYLIKFIYFQLKSWFCYKNKSDKNIFKMEHLTQIIDLKF